MSILANCPGGLLLEPPEAVVTETDLENTLFFSLVSPSSIFLFLRPGLAGLMGSGRQEEEELSPSGLTEQKMHGS